MSNEEDEINPFSREYTARQENAPAEPLQPQPPPQPRGGRNFLVWLIPLLLAMFILPMLCCGAVLFWGFNEFVEEMNEPAEVALAVINADDQIAAKLGTPIERTSKFAVNNYKNENGNGGAEVDFNIKGPDGSARVRGKMKLFASVWSPEDLTITCNDGSEFKLPATVDVEPGKSF